MKNRAQIFSLDAIIALGLFVLIIISAAWSWDSVRERVYLQETRNDLEMVARNAFSSLVLKSGEPADWQTQADLTGVSSLGLAANRPYLIDIDKAVKLQELSQTPEGYAQIKETLGFKGPYDFLLTVSSGAAYYTIGTAPVSSENIVIVTRYMTDGTAWYVLDMRAWIK